jgi:hypothetical protein
MDNPQAEVSEAAPESEVVEWADDELAGRLWIKVIGPLVQCRSQDSDPSPRVQLALDRMFIAACERATRIFNSDVEPIE